MRARRDTGSNPKNGEALAGGAVQGFRGGVAQSVSHQFTAVDLQLQAFAMLRAQLEMKGYALALNSAGICFVGKWGFIKRLGSMADAEAFSRKVGAI